MDDLIFHFACLAVGLSGLGVSTLMIIRSQSTKARIGNLLYKPSDYFREDWMTIGITLFVLLVAEIGLHYTPEENKGGKWFALEVLSLFFTLGYMATDIASRFVSVVSRRLNTALDYKTNIADQASGIPKGTLTPAVMPPKEEAKPPSQP